MAELEADAGAWSTWFLMTRSVFYNLDSSEGERAIARLRELGHRVAHHAVWPHVDLDERFDPVVAWHNPDPEYMTAPIDGAPNVMTAPWFDPERYRSDSNQHWRHGCPHEQLATRRVRVAPAPHAPGDLGLRRRDDGRDDAVVPRRRPRSAARAPARGQDRPLVRPITVVVTASGAPGTAALLRGAARERRARGASRRHRHERAVGGPAPLRRVPSRPRGLRSGVRRRGARDRRPGGRRRDPAAVVVRPRGPRRRARPLRRDRRARLAARRDPALERQGRDVRAAPPARPAGARVPARARRARGRGGGARARLPGAAGLLQAGVLVRLARVPRARPDRRPGAPAPARAAGLGGDAARGGARAAAGRGRHRAARDGARDRRRAHDRRNRERARGRARPPEDARGDARGPRDVLRHARGRGADGAGRARSSRSSGSSTSSTSSSSASS